MAQDGTSVPMAPINLFDNWMAGAFSSCCGVNLACAAFGVAVRLEEAGSAPHI
jgi:hypothetical protein